MYVGIVQLGRDDEGEIKVVAASYGMGAAAITDGDGAFNNWSMQLQVDGDDAVQELKPAAAGNKDTVGFVLAELPGGRLTGWVHQGVVLEADDPQGGG